MADAHQLGKRAPLRLAPRRPPLEADRPGRTQREAAERRSGHHAALGPDLIDVCVQLDCEAGLVEARRQCRALASRAGFLEADCALMTAIVSELGRNILVHAAPGEISFKLVEVGRRIGLRITARDTGPGIPNLVQAMRDGYSSGGRSGIGLGGVRRLSDDFQIDSAPGRGTVVVVRKWQR